MKTSSAAVACNFHIRAEERVTPSLVEPLELETYPRQPLDVDGTRSVAHVSISRNPLEQLAVTMRLRPPARTSGPDAMGISTYGRTSNDAAPALVAAGWGW
jgi:hypothetical protein